MTPERPVRDRLAGTRVLVTGSSSGIGEATVEHLARRGATVFAAARRPGRVAAVPGGTVEPVEMDVTDPRSVRTAIAGIHDRGGPLDGAVNNAGVELVGPLEHVGDEDLRWQFDTNVAGVLRVTRAVLPGMRERGHGRLVFVSSIVGRAARPFGGAYAASKYAVEGMAEALRWEVAPFGVQVAVVEPGRYPTRLGANQRTAQGYGADSPYRRFSEEYRAALPRLEPEGYAPDAATVAEVIAGLLGSDEAPPFRTTVGEDAAATAALLTDGGYERYEREMQRRLRLDGWPQPGGPAGDGSPAPLPEAVARLAGPAGIAVLTTLLPGGQPQSHVVWTECRDGSLLVNTEVHRRKYRNVQADPRVTMVLVDAADPHHFVEVRGRVVETIHGEPARAHADALSRAYRGRDYEAGLIRSERAVLRIEPLRCVEVRGPRYRATGWIGAASGWRPE